MATLDDAAAVLATGGLVVFPTESVYGLGADATSARAVDALVAARGRETGKPILVVASDVAMVTAVAAELSAVARRLAARFWPGPLTLVLPARAGLPAPLTAGTDTIGVRVPAHATARALAARLGRPVTAPSANPPGATPARTIAEARGYFGDRIGAYLDGGRCDGAASTVVAIEAERVRIVRAGPVDEAAIHRVMEEE
jgi:L-threonylcarbamoyladenylate synthase